ncbi:hypothetical protein BGK50_14265 [Shigella sp. FC130]|nr:hypothetical protein BGK50_14265 [Shigella sp. FC130]
MADDPTGFLSPTQFPSHLMSVGVPFGGKNGMMPYNVCEIKLDIVQQLAPTNGINFNTLRKTTP